MSFTPGPWKSIMNFSPIRRGCYDVLANDVRIANIIHFGKTDEEAFANARLVAAAPEMLELLRQAWLEIDNAVQTYIPKGEDGKDMVELCAKIEVLLNRIEGADPE